MSIAVSKLVAYLKNKLDADTNLSGLSIFGELSNYHKHNSGHLYFTIKDDKAALNCVMFSSNAKRLNFNPKNGDKVELKGNVSLFEVSGSLQFYATAMRLQGLGDLYAAYEKLKQQLFAEGIFAQEHKKQKPTLYPKKVAVLVGDNSAAMSDIKTCFKRRWPLAQVDYYPVLVQGNEAPLNIVKTLKEVDDLEYEFIILARGGGSFEDLFCFNDEKLVRTIYELKTFIITGIGHEQDYTLSDFVADLRAPTPTAAVELITPDIIKVSDTIKEYQRNIYNKTYNKLNLNRNKYLTLVSSKYFMNPYFIIEKSQMKLDYLGSKLANIKNQFSTIKTKIDNNSNIMKQILDNRIKKERMKIDHTKALIKVYDVDNTLSRGYSLVYKDDKLIKNHAELKKADEINIRLYGGTVRAKIDEDI